MLERETWHASITVERVAEGMEREMFTLDNPGFCLACGKEAVSCAPDARFYKCAHCGERQLFGANELLINMMQGIQ
jgi:hypothetical protein